MTNTDELEPTMRDLVIIQCVTGASMAVIRRAAASAGLHIDADGKITRDSP